jgi:hypothetical protein
MQNTLGPNLRKFFTNIISRLTGLSTVEDTKTSWAEGVESYAAVPDFFKSFFDAYRTGERNFPYAVLTPDFEGFINTTTEKLICDMGREICVLERNGNAFNEKCYPVEGISYVEMKTILLDSHIKISGVTRDGVSASSTLRFNTASDVRFTPILNKIRRAPVESTSAARSTGAEIFDSWMNLNFKFMNYARRSLMGGEKVIQAILQPEIRERVLVILGTTFFRRISPTVVCILTDRELIMIREDNKRGAGERFGGIWQYIPLDKIVKITLIPQEHDVLVFSVKLPPNDHLDYLFESSAKREVDRLLERFRELTLP